MHQPPDRDFTARIGRVLAALAPEPLRSSLATDGVATLRALCVEARRRHGWFGYAGALTVQTLSFFWAALENLGHCGILQRVHLAATCLSTRWT